MVSLDTLDKLELGVDDIHLLLDIEYAFLVAVPHFIHFVLFLRTFF